MTSRSTMTRKQTGYFKSFDGTKIYYEVRGEGQPLVLAYGIGCVMNHWIHQVRHFSKDYATILLDYRGHHKSETPADPAQMSIDALARDLEMLLDHLDLHTASFWGHSFGTQVLIRAYDLYPERFSNLIFINGFAGNPIRKMFGGDTADHVFRLLKSGYDVLPDTLGFLWRVAVTNPLAIQLSALLGGFNLHLTALKDIEIYARGVAGLDLTAFFTLFESMMNYDGRSVLPRIETPTLIIGGKKDSVTPLDVQEDIHRLITGSQILIAPQGTHCTQLDMPDLVNMRIEQFLKENYLA